MDKKKREPKVTCYVTINEEYRFSIDAIGKTLEAKTDKGWKTVGYYSQIEPMFKAISRREADEHGNQTIKEYLQVIIDENKKVHDLFSKLDFRA